MRMRRRESREGKQETRGQQRVTNCGWYPWWWREGEALQSAVGPFCCRGVGRRNANPQHFGLGFRQRDLGEPWGTPQHREGHIGARCRGKVIAKRVSLTWKGELIFNVAVARTPDGEDLHLMSFTTSMWFECVTRVPLTWKKATVTWWTCGGLDRGPCRLRTSHTQSYPLNVFMWLCNPSFWSHDIYCSVHPGEGSSSVAPLKVSSLFYPAKKKILLVFGELFLIGCEVKGQGCRTCADRKALLRQIRNIELYQINWISFLNRCRDQNLPSQSSFTLWRLTPCPDARR